MKKSSWSQKMSEVYSYKSASAEGNDSTIKQAELSSFHWARLSQVFLTVTCERELRALNMSKKTKQVKVMVVSRGVITLSCNWKHKDKNWWSSAGPSRSQPTVNMVGSVRLSPARFSPARFFEDPCAHLSPEDEQRPADDDERRHQNFDEQTASEDAVSDVTRRLPDDVTVHRLHPQTDNTTTHSCWYTTTTTHSWYTTTRTHCPCTSEQAVRPWWCWSTGSAWRSAGWGSSSALPGRWASELRCSCGAVTTLLITCSAKRKLSGGNERVWLTCSAGSGQSS